MNLVRDVLGMVVSGYTWNLLFIGRSAKRLSEKQVLSFLIPIIYYNGLRLKAKHGHLLKAETHKQEITIHRIVVTYPTDLRLADRQRTMLIVYYRS